MATGRVWCVANAARRSLWAAAAAAGVEAPEREGRQPRPRSARGGGACRSGLRTGPGGRTLVFETIAQKGGLESGCLPMSKHRRQSAASAVHAAAALQRRGASKPRARRGSPTPCTRPARRARRGDRGGGPERAVSGLSRPALAALPQLLRRLAEPARDGKTLTLREVLQPRTRRPTRRKPHFSRRCCRRAAS